VEEEANEANFLGVEAVLNWMGRKDSQESCMSLIF
jgi:hypothetical protein